MKITYELYENNLTLFKKKINLVCKLCKDLGLFGLSSCKTTYANK